MSVLAIDFGERRIGLAICHDQSSVVLPLDTIERSSDRQAIETIAALAIEESVDRLVLGEPVGVGGQRGENVERVHRFGAKLEAATGLSVTYVVETLTTVAAEERLRESGLDPRRHADKLDALAAQILLEEHLAAVS